MNTDKKYTMILFGNDVTGEILVDIVFADTCHELLKNFKSKLLYQKTYFNETGEMVSEGSTKDAYLINDFDKFTQKINLNMIEKIRELKQKIEFDGIDEDTILVDTIKDCDFELSGIAEDIFNIYEKSTDKKSLEQLFYEFTDIEFDEYLERCIKRIGKDD